MLKRKPELKKTLLNLKLVLKLKPVLKNGFKTETAFLKKPVLKNEFKTETGILKNGVKTETATLKKPVLKLKALNSVLKLKPIF